MKNDGGSAFPLESTVVNGDGWRIPNVGMSLRDYFAAKALPAVIELCHNDDRDGMTFESYFAMKSYELADAMLKERTQ